MNEHQYTIGQAVVVDTLDEAILIRISSLHWLINELEYNKDVAQSVKDLRYETYLLEEVLRKKLT